MQLERGPEAFAGLLFSFCANQKIQRVAVLRKEAGDEVAAKIAGRAG